MKILLVEDDQWYGESLKNMLGQNLLLVDSPEAAIAKIDDFKPEVILLDFQLGSKNALVLLNELQSYTDSRAIPVVILATEAKRLKLEDLAQYGVKKILDKATAQPAAILRELENV